MYKCTNCKWEGEELTKQSGQVKLKDKCPACGDNVKLVGTLPKPKPVVKESESKTLKVKNAVFNRLKGIKEDLEDDGKLNYSNRPKKKRGRK